MDKSKDSFEDLNLLHHTQLPNKPLPLDGSGESVLQRVLGEVEEKIIAEATSVATDAGRDVVIESDVCCGWRRVLVV